MLYENDFYVVREDGRGDLQAEVLIEDPAAVVSHGRGRGLELLVISFDSRYIDAVGAGLVDWIWRMVAAVDPAHAFMAAGSDTEYISKERRFRNVMYDSLPDVVARGALEVVHPIMYFAERVPVAPPHRPWTVERRERGALWLFVFTGDNGGFEIPEPGNLYPRIFEAATGRSAPSS